MVRCCILLEQEVSLSIQLILVTLNGIHIYGFVSFKVLTNVLTDFGFTLYCPPYYAKACLLI